MLIPQRKCHVNIGVSASGHAVAFNKCNFSLSDIPESCASYETSIAAICRETRHQRNGARCDGAQSKQTFVTIQFQHSDLVRNIDIRQALKRFADCITPDVSCSFRTAFHAASHT